MDITAFKWKTTIAEALNWELHKKSLNQELTDQAEQQANEEIGAHFAEMKATARIQMIDGFFVVSFHEKDWRLNLKSGDEVFWSDPDEETCSRVLHIATIDILDPICIITEKNGTVVECLIEELS